MEQCILQLLQDHITALLTPPPTAKEQRVNNDIIREAEQRVIDDSPIITILLITDAPGIMEACNPAAKEKWKEMPRINCRLGWEIHSEFRWIPQLFQFWTFWTLEFPSEFYFSDCKMCSLQFWTYFFRFRILSRHWLFQFHELENVPAINVSGEWHQILIHSTHQLFLHAPLPSHCSWYLLDTHKN